MAGNSNLHDSIRNKQDEFYTEIGMIESELKYYRQHFKDKVVYCNCDDPRSSHFWRYFAVNFEFLGLKKLIATHYDAQRPTYKLELSKDITGDGKINEDDVVETPFLQNGDFRSPECIDLLQESDIVVTNPPFSLFREYLFQLLQYKKEFLISGRMSSVFYKEVFPCFKNNLIWLGHNSGHFWFRVPDYYEEKKTDFKIDENGQKWRRMGNICWITNLDYKERHEDKLLYKHYNPEDYPEYDNYYAINVSQTKDIPCDYDGVMGVPITFLSQWNPDQFELLGFTNTGETNEGIKHPNFPHGRAVLQGKEIYTRILIRKKR